MLFDRDALKDAVRERWLWVRGITRIGVGRLIGDDFMVLGGRFDLDQARQGFIRPLTHRYR